MRYLLIFLYCLTLQFSVAQTDSAQVENPLVEPKEYLRDFVAQLNNPGIASDIILSQFVRIQTQQSDEYLDYLEASIAEVRFNVQLKDIANFRYLNYAELPRKEVRDIDLEGKDPKQVFFIKHRDRLVFAVYLAENKVSSFTLVAKGSGKAHFVTY